MPDDQSLSFYSIQVGELEFSYAIRRGAVLRILVVDGTNDLDAAVLAAKAMNCEVVELLSDPPNKSGGRPSHSVLNHKPQKIEPNALPDDQTGTSTAVQDVVVSSAEANEPNSEPAQEPNQQEPEASGGV